jgi:hypothetical protein
MIPFAEGVLVASDVGDALRLKDLATYARGK